jgi:hypothetical protein
MRLADTKGAIYWGIVGLIGVLAALGYVDLLPLKVYILTPVSYIQQWLREFSLKLSIQSLANEYRKGCPTHEFTSVRILSRQPSMMLIEGFLTDLEAQFLVRVGYIYFSQL